MGTGNSCPRVENLGHDTDHLPPSNAKVKNVKPTSTPSVHLGMVLS